jgi:hypothetical protein
LAHERDVQEWVILMKQRKIWFCLAELRKRTTVFVDVVVG